MVPVPSRSASPLPDANQDFASKVHLVDTVKGKIDGAWELSDNQMELRLRHLEPQRKLVLTVDKGLLAVNDKRLEQESVTRLETRDMQPTVGFASRGSLLPTRLAEGLPVIALNVDKVDVEFFRIKPDMLSSFWSTGVATAACTTTSPRKPWTWPTGLQRPLRPQPCAQHPRDCAAADRRDQAAAGAGRVPGGDARLGHL